MSSEKKFVLKILLTIIVLALICAFIPTPIIFITKLFQKYKILYLLVYIVLFALVNKAFTGNLIAFWDGMDSYYNIPDLQGARVIRENPNLKVDKDFYNREIPCNKDLLCLFWFLFQYNLVNNDTDLIGALILKWIDEGNAFFIKENQVRLNPSYNINNDLEKELFLMLRNASRDDILESNEFSKWMKINKNIVSQWFLKVIEYYNRFFRDRGYIYTKNNLKIISQELDDEYKNIVGFKNFLSDFGRMQEKFTMEVTLWKEF